MSLNKNSAENKSFTEEEYENEILNNETEEIEETAEESTERKCPHCGNTAVANGHEYCYKCEQELLKTKIPFLGWVLGFVSVGVSLFCFLIVVLLSTSVLQTVKGNMAAKDNNWFSAYEEYADVEEQLNTITGIIGDNKVFSPFFKLGCGIEAKIYKAAVHIYNPIDGYNLAERIFVKNQNYIEHNKDYKICKSYFEEVQSVTAAFGDTFADLESVTEPTPELGKEYVAKMETFRGKEGVSEIWLDYLIYDIGSGFGIDDQTQLKYLQAVHKNAVKADKDYSWLYLKDYIILLEKLNMDDEALPLAKQLSEMDISDYDPAAYMIKIYGKKGDIASAKKVCDAYCEKNLTTKGKQSDSNYCLNIIIARMEGNYDSALALIEEGAEIYTLNPEMLRQKVLILLAQGKYDEAYDTACDVDGVLSSRNYYGDSSVYTNENLTTIYVAAALYKEYGTGKAKNHENLEELMEGYKNNARESLVSDIISGKIDLNKNLTTGGCDIL